MAEDDTTRTTAKTLWTETILEILYETLRKEKSDASLREILREVLEKGYKPHYIIDKVRKKVDDRAASRVQLLLKKK